MLSCDPLKHFRTDLVIMGAEQDCFVLSILVRTEGFVTGVDMTQEQVSMGGVWGGGGGG